MKYLIQGGESAARFDALLKFTKISSSDILAALHDYLVRGFSDSAAAAMNGVPLPNFNRALNTLNNVAENVEAIKVLDWNHLTDKLWYSVSDVKPPYDTNVLVQFTTVTGDRQHTTAKYINECIGNYTERRVPVWYVTVSSGHRLNTVTHWRHLPTVALVHHD